MSTTTTTTTPSHCIRLSSADRYKLARFIEKHIEPDGEKYVKYTNNWTDETVLGKIDIPGINIVHVRSVRKLVFGKIRPTWAAGRRKRAEKIKASPLALEKRVAGWVGEINARLDIFARRIDELEDRSSGLQRVGVAAPVTGYISGHMASPLSPPLVPSQSIPIRETPSREVHGANGDNHNR